MWGTWRAAAVEPEAIHRVYGIPEKNNDDTDQLLLQLFNKRMKMTPPIELQDIEIWHRIGRITNGGESSDPPPPRPIIARFASRRIKGAVMRQKKKLWRRRAPERDAYLENEPGNDEANTDCTDGEEN